MRATMAAKFFLSFSLLISSCVFVAFSQDGPDLNRLISGVISQGTGIANVMPCMQKLTPCKPFLNSSMPIPPICCDPLKEILANDTTCLCNVLNSPNMLSTFDVPHADLLKIPEGCGTKFDVSVCKTDATPPTPTVQSDLATIYSPPAPEAKSAAGGIYHLGAYGLIASTMALIIASVA